MKTLKVLLCGLLLALPVFANETDDRKTATSLKYVTHELDTRQNKLETGTNQAITYTNAAGGVVQRTVKSDLAGGSILDTSLPTVGAVTDGLSHKQNEIEPINDHIAVTYTGQTGEISTKGIYQSNGTYIDQTDSLIDAKTFNAALKKGLDNEFICSDNLSPNGDCWLWEIHSTVGRVLPPAYTQLEYIESTGTQYIDTGVKGNLNTRIKVVFQYSALNLAAPSGRLLGTRTGQNANAFMIGTGDGSTNSSASWFAQFDSVQPTVIDVVSVDSNKHTMVLSKDGFYVDGSLTRSFYNPTSFETAETIPLFNTSHDVSGGAGRAKVYSFKLWNNDTLMRDFIPAIQNSDNKVGMYDTVSGTFFENAGAGTFGAGPELRSTVYIPQAQ